MTLRGRPDVVVVVADCLRDDEFERESRESAFLAELRRRSVTFPHCSSVSNWTVPAHVSILTGLYPFEHNVHRLGIRSIPSTMPTLATSLSSLGYATQLLSANHNIRPDIGFGNGFDQLAWGIWGENALRLTSPAHAPFDSRSTSGEDVVRKNLIESDPSGWWKVARPVAELLPRFPWMLDAASRARIGMAGIGADKDYRVAPWVDEALSQFLRRVPTTRPILSVLNLMECHEPYLPEPGESESIAEWLRSVTTRQDIVAWARGRWKPSGVQLEVLRRLYRQKVRALGTRIHGIVERLKHSGRWDDTLFVLVGDHGQAFGEHEQLFHGGELYEPVTHVPLWIRYPHDEYGGTTARAEASLVDIYPTVMSAIHRRSTPTGSGRSLETLLDHPRPDTTVSVADGRTAFGSANGTAPNVWDRPQIAICAEEYKVIVDCPSGRTHAFRLGQDPQESTDLWPSMEHELRTPTDRAFRIGAQMWPRALEGYESAATSRLRQWGYLD
jgi:arylsulfatase A-like enzyme